MSKYTHAAKFTAAYVQGSYGFSFTKFLTEDPKIRTLRMIAYSDDDLTDRVSAQKAAIKLIGHMLSLGFEAESEDAIEESLVTVARLIKTGKEKASVLSEAVNAGFIFADEIEINGASE